MGSRYRSSRRVPGGVCDPPKVGPGGGAAGGAGAGPAPPVGTSTGLRISRLRVTFPATLLGPSSLRATAMVFPPRKRTGTGKLEPKERPKDRKVKTCSDRGQETDDSARKSLRRQ